MTAYAQYSAMALFRYPDGQIHQIATQANNDGDVIQLADGRLGVVAGVGGGVDNISIGDPENIWNAGVFEMLSNGAAFTQGQTVYWDPILKQIVPTYNAADATYLAGFVTKAVSAGGTTVLVDINAGFNVNNVLYLNAAVSSASESGSTVTYTSSVLHGLVVGQTVWISGMLPAAYNGCFVVTAVGSSTTFSVTNSVSGIGASTQAGTATWVSTAQAAIVAAAGTTQATAAPIISQQVFVTGASGTNGVLLPPPALTLQIVVVNESSANALLVYPHGTEKIDNGTGGAAKSQALSTTGVYRCDGTNWWEQTST